MFPGFPAPYLVPAPLIQHVCTLVKKTDLALQMVHVYGLQITMLLIKDAIHGLEINCMKVL